MGAATARDRSVRPVDPMNGETRPIRVLQVVAPAPVGGLERVVELLTVGLHRRGHVVTLVPVFSDDDSSGGFVDRIRDAGVPIEEIRTRARAYLRERRAFRRICAENRPDLVHTHGYRPDVVDSGAARKLGISTLTTVHGYTGNDLKNRFYETLQKGVLRRFDAVVAVSEVLEEELRERPLGPGRVRCIPNAYAPRRNLFPAEEARRRLGARRDRFNAGWVGRISHEKGPDVLVEALEHLSDLPLTVHFLGDGRAASPLRERTRRGVPGTTRVRWHGTVPEAARLFPAFDVFVLSSRSEGTPMVLFEAMDSGVPVVATRVGGVPRVVTPETGSLVPPDDPEELAAALRAVHDDPGSARDRAVAARARLASRFGVDRWLARHEALYRELADGGRDVSGSP